MFGIDKHPSIPCTKSYDHVEALRFEYFIDEEYQYNLYLDGLPAAVVLRNHETGELETSYQDGIPVGYYDKNLKEYIVYNHLHMEVKYSKVSKTVKQIVGFEIEPRSVHKQSMISWDHEQSTAVQ